MASSISARGTCRCFQRGRLGPAVSRRPFLCPRTLPVAPLVHRQQRNVQTGPAQPGSPGVARVLADHHSSDVPLRKQIKDEAKARKASGQGKRSTRQGQTVPGWELTVGIEIHAQLNTRRKLFSRATVPAPHDQPNTHVAFFDVALPGAQPIFQPETLIPAIRAALALNCRIQRVSRFDRKHYFHWDQPAGYQITQFYEPLARGGHIMLYARDGIAPEDGESLRVDIVQVQMEQDTAKTISQPGPVHWLDFNRAGVPLIEIITAPQMHHPATAAALVRKIQQLLRAVDACTSGMEEGGLRADVNVSVRRVGQEKLGTRTEIKNLNSFRAVEDAIIAERNRQIREIEQHGSADVIKSETRGFTTSTGTGGETHRLRGKEGEVDYRYMPDPDLGPVIISDEVIEYLRRTSGKLPDEEVEDLMALYGLSTKDAMALVQLDDGGRVEYYYDVVDAFERRLQSQERPESPENRGDAGPHRPFIANWILHQLGKLTSERSSSNSSSSSMLEWEDDHDADAAVRRNDLEMTPEGRCRIPVDALADILFFRHQGKITTKVAKDLLFSVFYGDIGAADPASPDVQSAIEQGHLWFDEISADEYRALALEAVQGEEKTLKLFVAPKRFPQGKLQYLIGKVLRAGPEGRTDPLHAEAAMRAVIEEHVQKQTGNTGN